MTLSLMLVMVSTSWAVRPTDSLNGQRIIESIESSYPQMDRDLFKRVRLQLVSDEWNAEWTPTLDWTQPNMERTYLGDIHLGRVLHRGVVSVVARIRNHPGKIIKYEANCEIEKSVHPLIRDYWYMNDAHAKGLAPAALFLSPPSTLCALREGKCAFRMTDAEFRECENRRGTLRYMIMEEARGVSLHDFRMRRFKDGAMGIRNSLSIGAKLIDTIHRLHFDAKVVHGDIHSPNVMIDYDDQSGNFTLQLIDFGHSFHNSDTPWRTEPVRMTHQYHHELLTIWQMQGNAWAPRDDVAKAFQTIAHLMHSFRYLEFERRLKEAGPSMLRDFKLNRNWFVTPIFNPFEHLQLDPGIEDRIQNVLIELLTNVRDLHINDPIPYNNLGSSMIECVRLLSEGKKPLDA